MAVSKVIKSESKVDSDENLETLCPQLRDRCNTWPRQLQAVSPAPSPPYSSHSPGQALPSVTEDDPKEEEEDDFSPSSSIGSYKSKPNARRNPWGNSSYADLITMAIQSAPDRRLTLSQIYDWMVGAVPYFTERADSSSSAGWKNSVRHNLSLHQKFLKIPNEGAGKSSWWTLNPDSCGARKPRRRATSGDMKQLQTRRDRARARLESARPPSQHRSRSGSLSSLPPLLPVSQYSSEPGGVQWGSYRSRNLSTASSASCSEPVQQLNLEDLVSSELSAMPQNLCDEAGEVGVLPSLLPGESDISTFHLDCLNMQPEYSTEFSNEKQRLKILEPRETPGLFQSNPSPGCGAGQAERERADQERRLMIVKQLEILTNKRQLENADVDVSILLLQEQLDKVEGGWSGLSFGSAPTSATPFHQ